LVDTFAQCIQGYGYILLFHTFRCIQIQTYVGVGSISTSTVFVYTVFVIYITTKKKYY